MPRNIAVAGMGFVGLAQTIALAERGHYVIGVETSQRRLDWLIDFCTGNRQDFPIFERDLDTATREVYRAGKLSFTNNLEQAIRNSEMLFVAVPTPSKQDGSADISIVLKVAEEASRFLNRKNRYMFILKSTVPPGTSIQVNKFFEGFNTAVISNPEFMAEGTALRDTTHPKRVVVGTNIGWAMEEMKLLYGDFLREGQPFRAMDNISAELTKYQANVSLALQVAMANIGANLSRNAGGDWEKVREAVGDDPRQGRFLRCSLGYGGACFPKEVRQYIHSLRQFGSDKRDIDLIESLLVQNEYQKLVLNQELHNYYGHDLNGKIITLWGLSFKAGTSDTREASSLSIIRDLIEHGAKVRVYDPQAIKTGELRQEFLEHLSIGDKSSLITFCDSMEEAAAGSYGILIPTEWPQFENPRIRKIQEVMVQPAIFDGRDLYNSLMFRNTGIDYFSVGRPKSLAKERT